MKTQTKSKKVNKAWLHDHMNDTYVKLAQREGYRARAAYKLKEIDEELQLLKPGQLVVDLGATPGAWSQYVRRKFAPKDVGSGGAVVREHPHLDEAVRVQRQVDFLFHRGGQAVATDHHDRVEVMSFGAVVLALGRCQIDSSHTRIIPGQ